jgi:hypothetical protein
MEPTQLADRLAIKASEAFSFLLGLSGIKALLKDDSKIPEPHSILCGKSVEIC